jgi:hypothetical protein
MNKIDLIIDALECDSGFYDEHKLKQAIAAAHELKALKPVAWQNKYFPDEVNRHKRISMHPQIPLYALDKEQA